MDTVALIGSPPDGERIVSMVSHRDMIFVATEYHVYLLTEENCFKKVEFIHETKHKE